MVLEKLSPGDETAYTLKCEIPIEKMGQSTILDEFVGYIYPYKKAP